jgi:hypothetical protein
MSLRPLGSSRKAEVSFGSWVTSNAGPHGGWVTGREMKEKLLSSRRKEYVSGDAVKLAAILRTSSLFLRPPSAIALEIGPLNFALTADH